MKQVIVFYLLFISPIFCYSQETHYTEEDMFDFRLGMTIDEFKAIIDTSLLHTELHQEMDSSFQLFYLEKHVMSASKLFIVEDWSFVFQHNKLVLISTPIYNDIVEGLLTSVCGEPLVDTIKQTNGYETIRTVWDINNIDVIATSSLEINPSTNEFTDYAFTIGYFSKINRWTLNGLYNFELGMSVEEMQALVDTTLLIEDHTPPIAKIRSFFLQNYVVDQEATYVLHNLELNFYNDQLFQIVIRYYDGDTESNLATLYGMPKEEIEEREDGFEECTYTWNTNIENVFCYSKTMRNPQKRIITDYKLSIVNYKQLMNSMLDPTSIEADMKILDKWREKRKDN